MQAAEGDVAFVAFLKHQIVIDSFMRQKLCTQAFTVNIDGIVHGCTQEVGTVDNTFKSGAFTVDFYI